MGVIAAASSAPARRPRYGGTLRVEIGAILNSVDPSAIPANSDFTDPLTAIVSLIYDHRNSDGTFAGAGAFRIAAWDPSHQLVLRANEDFPGGRPFVDSLDIQMGRNAKDRLLDLQLDKTDVAEIPAEQARHAADQGVRISVSQPAELIALVFLPGQPGSDDSHAREAVTHAIDRAAMVNFILQKEGEPAGGLLPQWVSGTAFLFPTAPDITKSKELWSQFGASARLTLGYDFGDPLTQALAERIAVNVREAGISLAAVPLAGSASQNVSARLVRVHIDSSAPVAALNRMARAIGPITGIDATPLPESSGAAQIYDRERSMLDGFRVVPLVWIPRVFGLNQRVKDWRAPSPGEGWSFADVWLDTPAAVAGAQP